MGQLLIYNSYPLKEKGTVMSTSYSILSKSSPASTTDNDENQIMYLNDSRLSYILPRTLMSCYCNDGLFESGLIEWSKQFCSTNATFLDIGAHTGTYTISLSKHCKRVVSFEPQQMTYYALCGSVALSNLRNVQCLQIGLGSPDQVGTSTSCKKHRTGPIRNLLFAS